MSLPFAQKQRSSRAAGRPACPDFGRPILGWRRDLNTHMRGEIVEFRKYGGSTTGDEWQISYPDGVTLWSWARLTQWVDSQPPHSPVSSITAAAAAAAMANNAAVNAEAQPAAPSLALTATDAAVAAAAAEEEEQAEEQQQQQQAAAEGKQQQQATENGSLAGREAELVGLKDKPHLNGQRVTIGEYRSEGKAKGRYTICVAKEKLALRRANLQLVPARTESDSEASLEQPGRAHGSSWASGGGGGGGSSSGSSGGCDGEAAIAREGAAAGSGLEASTPAVDWWDMSSSDDDAAAGSGLEEAALTGLQVACSPGGNASATRRRRTQRPFSLINPPTKRGKKRLAQSASAPAPPRRRGGVVYMRSTDPPADCAIPGCCTAANRPHPLVAGLRVCERHRDLAERAALARRPPCDTVPDGSSSVRCAAGSEGWACNSLGCQVGLRRGCILCGVGGPSDGEEGEEQGKKERGEQRRGGVSGGSGGSGGGGGGSGRGGSSSVGGDTVSSAGDEAGGGSSCSLEPVSCAKPGCTARLHDGCRKLLARRVQVWWEGDRKWFWGTADDFEAGGGGGFEGGGGERTVHYDDGTQQEERLGEAAGEEEVECRWLVRRSPGQLHASVWQSACTCSKGVVAEEGAARDLEENARHCAICCLADYRHGSESGPVNHLVFCDGCGLCVHMFCYGVNATGKEFGRAAVDSIRFECDVCLHLRGRPAAPPACSLCPSPGGALRRQQSGRFAHVSCIEFGYFDYPLAPQHESGSLCRRGSGCGACLKSRYRDSRRRRDVMAAVRRSGWRCTAPGCLDRNHTAGLVLCGGQGAGCRHAAHVSCAQRVGSGWHLKQKEMSDSTAIEITCEECSDVYLDVRDDRPPAYLQRAVVPPVAIAPFASDEAYATARFTFQDWAHGPCFGFTRVGLRGGGLCVGACDSARDARAQYVATFRSKEPLDNIWRMGKDPRVSRSTDVIYCGFCCKPFSPAGNGLGFDDVHFGDNFDLLAKARCDRRDVLLLEDKCLICENVPALLNHITLDRIERLGFYCKVYVVSGSQFRCASARQRLVLVGFRDRAALDRFTPPPPQSVASTPLRAILQDFSQESSPDLFINARKFRMVTSDSHVVSLGYPHGARSPTSSYGSLTTPGTLLCVAKHFKDRELPLTPAQVQQLDYGHLRRRSARHLLPRDPCALHTPPVNRLHPMEQLASFSYEAHEQPQLRGRLTAQYTAVAQTICLNIFEAFQAEVLAAIGKPSVRTELYERLDRMGVTAHRSSGSGNWLETRVSRTGVPFYKYLPLKEFDDPADELSEYELWVQENIRENKRLLEKLGLVS